MRIDMPHHHGSSGTVSLVGSPLKLTETPVSYRRAPPLAGQNTREILSTIFGLDDAQIAKLADV